MAVQSRLTRSVGGIDLPVAGTWVFDSSHTEVAFEGRHLMVTPVRGRFEKFRGRLIVADAPDESVARSRSKLPASHPASKTATTIFAVLIGSTRSAIPSSPFGRPGSSTSTTAAGGRRGS